MYAVACILAICGCKSVLASDDPCTPAAAASSELEKNLATVDSDKVAEALSKTGVLATGGRVEFVVERAFDKDISYGALIRRGRSNETAPSEGRALLHGSDVMARDISKDDSLVKDGIVSGDSTVVDVRIPGRLAGFWEIGTVYLYGCKAGKQEFVAVVAAPLSSHTYSLAFAVALVGLTFLLLASAVALVDIKRKNDPWSFRKSVRYLDPVFLTAGADGKGSLSRLQIFFFSFVVFGLLAYIIMRTGVLSDLSKTILLLLGISGIGAAASKATDVSRNRLHFENWAWLIEKKWLPEGGLAAANVARWRDIVTSDGEFDVYHFQMLIFSVLVGGALLVCPWKDLASFTVPDTLLGVLGLSQVIYVGGKLTLPPSSSDLDAALTKLRQLETDFANAALTTADPKAAAGQDPLAPPADLVAAIRRAGYTKYNTYMKSAKRAAIMFTSVTGRSVATMDLEPAIG
jgi:hypothetical protein